MNDDVRICDSDTDFTSNETVIPIDILEDTAEVYREFYFKNKSTMGLRIGSLISSSSCNTLPSPKGHSSNIQSLPHFNE